MLLTMEEAYKKEWKYFPNPERIDKVEDSMSNLESVVRERNKAYHMLEIGTTGERPVELKYNALGKIFYIYLYIYITYIYIYFFFLQHIFNICCKKKYIKNCK